jgi:hypothetical protein
MASIEVTFLNPHDYLVKSLQRAYVSARVPITEVSRGDFGALLTGGRLLAGPRLRVPTVVGWSTDLNDYS